MSIFATQAIVIPNSVLSEEAFKGLGEFLKEELDSESEYESESEVVELANEDELALLKLCLPQRLVDSFERRGISSLFPIQSSRECCPLSKTSSFNRATSRRALSSALPNSPASQSKPTDCR